MCQNYGPVSGLACMPFLFFFSFFLFSVEPCHMNAYWKLRLCLSHESIVGVGICVDFLSVKYVPCCYRKTFFS